MVSELWSPFALIFIALVIITLVSQPRRVWRLAREITTIEVLTLMVLILLVGNIKWKCIFLDITPPFGLLCVLAARWILRWKGTESWSNRGRIEDVAIQCSSLRYPLQWIMPRRIQQNSCLDNQKYKNTLLHFILFVIYLFNLLQLSPVHAPFLAPLPKRDWQPFNTSGCKWLLFVHRDCLRCVA